MDLFKYAYSLYPFIPSSLLLGSLRLAIEARKIDMRASPYDVSKVDNCGPPICVETTEGKREYMILQEELAVAAAPIRAELLLEYEKVLQILQQK